MNQSINEVTTDSIERRGQIRSHWMTITGTLAILVAGTTACSPSSEQLLSSTNTLPAPDYTEASAWFAFPGRNGPERSVPPGFKAVDEANAPADVFFVHPTTYLKNDVMNAPYNVAGELNSPVLLGQLSAFNGCCSIYAPHYRQASLKGIPDNEAITLAYSDIARAFRHYIEKYNHGRPFIIASHSQGTEHAVRLLQEEVLGKPLQNRLVVAYTVGAYTPSSFATVGLPTCSSAQQTGCVISWNTVQEGRKEASTLVKGVKFWWKGERVLSTVPSICVNPLTWDEADNADADANLGALEFPREPAPEHAIQLKPLIAGVTGARCKDTLLEVNIGSESSFNDKLSKSIGSYHLNDYGIFYANIRANANARVISWQKQNSNSR